MADADTGNDAAQFHKLSSDFLKWFKTSPGTRVSAKISLTDLRFRNAGRGVVANANISASEELFAIPQSLILHKSNSEVYSKLSASFAGLGTWDSLILVLLYEYLRRDSSPWFPYLQLLPTTFDTLIFWTPEELAELQGSAVVDKIGKQAAEENWKSTILPIMMSNDALFPLATTSPENREKQLLLLAHMAGSMIMAYAFDIDEDEFDGSEEDALDEGDCELRQDNEDDPAKGMVPFADMLNADAHRNNARLFQEDKYFIMRAIKDIQAGDEVLNDYGPLPRSDLLRMYGYITDNYSTFDVVEIKADLIENVARSSGTPRSYLAQKREELESLGLIDDAFVMVRSAPNAKLEHLIPADLKMLITAFCLPAARRYPSKANKHINNSSLTVPEASLLSTSIINRLGNYRSSLQEDSRILENLGGRKQFPIPNGVSQKRYQMAVQVRKGEKDILNHVLQLLQAFIDQQTRQVATGSAKRKRDKSDEAFLNENRPVRG